MSKAQTTPPPVKATSQAVAQGGTTTSPKAPRSLSLP